MQLLFEIGFSPVLRIAEFSNPDLTIEIAGPDRRIVHIAGHHDMGGFVIAG